MGAENWERNTGILLYLQNEVVVVCTCELQKIRENVYVVVEFGNII